MMTKFASMLLGSGLLLLSATGAQAASSAVDIEQIGTTRAVAIVSQSGAGNVATIRQTDGTHHANVAMTGAANVTTVRQSGAGSDTLSAVVAGMGNHVSVNQTAAALGANIASLAVNGSDNMASVAQTALGGTNSASLTQTGSGNSTTLAQTGGDNGATLGQTGIGNTLGLAQTGFGNSAALSQVGHGLGLTISQTGGESISISQTGH